MNQRLVGLILGSKFLSNIQVLMIRYFGKYRMEQGLVGLILGSNFLSNILVLRLRFFWEI